MSSTHVATAVALASLLLLPVTGLAATESEQLLARSIAYHDPNGVWGRQPLRLSFEERRPDGESRETRVTLDPARERFEWWSRRGEHVLEGALTGGRCSFALDGSTTISDNDRKKHRLDCDRLTLYRNYYSYLWGLPMKLEDPGTRIEPEALDASFNGRAVLGLRVSYDSEVGSDTWYLYFDPLTSALVGYRFYHDEAANDGEYIVLEGEEIGAGLRLPKARTWYTNGDDRLLGTDTLIALETTSE